MKLHPLSLAVGAGLALAAAILSAQQFPSHNAVEVVRVREPVAVRGIADPQQAVRITEGQPYAVPAQKLLVLTALGSIEYPHNCRLMINGSVEARTKEYGSGGIWPSMVELPLPGLVAREGDTIEVVGGNTSTGDVRAWGYLTEK